MTEYRYKYGDKPNTPPCVMALGFFDGVHVGHRALLARARSRADELGLALGVFTFSSEGKIKEGAARVYDDKEKAKILQELGVDFIVFADFDSVRSVSSEEFVKNILVDNFDTACAVCGYNYRFGKRAMASAKDLESLMNELSRECIICDNYTVNGLSVSTTLIRGLLSSANIGEANALLGKPFRISGKVSSGNGVGRSLGYPTVNIALPSPSPLKHGVYASALKIGGRLYKAVTNVGICPTFREREEHLEAYILDFSGSLYGENLTVYILDFLREEKRFSTEKELIMQINIDKNTVLYKIGDEVWEQIGQKLQ